VFEERSGVCAALEVSGNRRRLEAEVETVIFRIGQEALTNVARHAAAAHVMVRLVFGDEMVQLVVTDDGRGFDPREAFDASGRQRRAWGLLVARVRSYHSRVRVPPSLCRFLSTAMVMTAMRHKRKE
jgi:signal transduction histidine kinase